jgi:uncharacterized protein YbjT (DUF2867 family)
MTGGSGFLGEYVPPEVARRGHETTALAIDAAARDLGYRPRPFGGGIRAEACALGLRALMAVPR